MTPPKRKPARRGRKSSPAAKRPRAPTRSPVAELPLQQGLLEMATIGTQSALWLVMAAAIIAALAGVAFGVWSFRPIPEYSSEGVTAGSPFDVTFRVENASAWFPLSHLRISCVLVRPAAPDMPPVEANGLRASSGLGPGESTSFTCPVRIALGSSTNDDLDVALRSEIYFRSEYDVPVAGSFSIRLADDRGPFVLNTRILPPRWTARPGR
jgi:hypothetical protein